MKPHATVRLNVCNTYNDTEFILYILVKRGMTLHLHLQYYWTTNGPLNGVDLASRGSRELRLDRGSLQGGYNYSFTCRVVAEDNSGDNATGSAVVAVSSKGAVAKLAAKELSFGSDNIILLDGSLSIDLDHRKGQMKVR
jgi:hypothetical protein